MFKFNGLAICITALVLTQYTEGACTPNDVRSDLTMCLQYERLYTFFQFPIKVSNFTSLCNNSTCFAYCIESTIQACQSYDFMAHLGDGSAMKAAYLGFCNHNDTVLSEDLGCMENASNQAALNIISTFDTAWQDSFDRNVANNVTLCNDWTIMVANLTALLTPDCSGNGLIIWQTFLNTVVGHCTELTPSFYANYSDTNVKSCNRAPGFPVSIETVLLTLITGFRLWVL